MQQIAPKLEASPPSLDGLLALKGVIEVSNSEEREDERRNAEAAVTAGFAEVIDALGEMRRHEGAALGRVLPRDWTKSRRSPSAPSVLRAAGPKRYGRGLPSKSQRCSNSPSASIPTGCTRKRS